MTQAEIKQQVCNKFGKNDPTSLTRAEEFLHFHYKNVWNRFVWKDSLDYVTTTSVANTSTLTDNGTFELVNGVSYDGNQLQNVSYDRIMSTQPNIFSQTGIPVGYINRPKVNGNCVIQFVPIPDSAKQVIITGKKVFVQLTGDSDSPLINGIDEVLVNLVAADFLERQRQFGKAQAKRTEANIALKAMESLELEQQQAIRRITPNVTNWQREEVILGAAGLPSKNAIYSGW